MTMWTCKACGLLIIPDGITAEDLAKAMKDHLAECTGERR